VWVAGCSPQCELDCQELQESLPAYLFPVCELQEQENRQIGRTGCKSATRV